MCNTEFVSFSGTSGHGLSEFLWSANRVHGLKCSQARHTAGRVSTPSSAADSTCFLNKCR